MLFRGIFISLLCPLGGRMAQSVYCLVYGLDVTGLESRQRQETLLLQNAQTKSETHPDL